MNFYTVVEGANTEPYIYPEWIKCVNPDLSKVEYADDLHEDNFFILSGGGYPTYLDVISGSVEEVLALNAEGTRSAVRLVVSVDSEDMSREEKYLEIEAAILDAAGGKWLEYKIIVQHFCFEAWALGNRKISPRNPNDGMLRIYKNIHDVGARDPELLPALEVENLNRSQFATKYLGLLLRDRHRNVTYSKKRPDFVAHPKYFSNLKSRLDQTGHIGSFSEFILAFR